MDISYILWGLTLLQLKTGFCYCILRISGTIFTLNTVRHMNTCAKGVRKVFTYESLINNSCDPSCYSNESYYGLKEGEDSAIIALRDIYPGDEITADYNLNGYDMAGN